MGAYREQAIEAIREQVGDKRVIPGLSGRCRQLRSRPF